MMGAACGAGHAYPSGYLISGVLCLIFPSIGIVVCIFIPDFPLGLIMCYFVTIHLL